MCHVFVLPWSACRNTFLLGEIIVGWNAGLVLLVTAVRCITSRQNIHAYEHLHALTRHFAWENPWCDGIDTDLHSRLTEFLSEESVELDSGRFGDIVHKVMLSRSCYSRN